MRDATDEVLAAFLADEYDGLLRMAALLQDDPADAAALVRTVLLDVTRRRRRLFRDGDPAAAARTALIRRVVASRPLHGRRAPSWVGSEPPGRYTDEQNDLRRALATLAPPTRAAVVLTAWAGWPDREIGAALRCTDEDVRREAAAGADALRAAAQGDLRGALDGLARRTASWVQDVPTAAELRTDVTRHRHRRWWQAGVAAACAAVLVAVPALTGNDGAPADRSGATAERPAAAPSPVDVAVLSPRGSLADDAAFLDGLRQLPWTDEVSTGEPLQIPTVPESRRVLYAGDVPGGRWALLVGRPAPGGEVSSPVVPDEVYLAWFTGPPDAGPEQMRLASYPYGVGPGLVPAFLDLSTGTMVVVAAPGDTIEISHGVEIAADGTDSRTWTAVETMDGIATTRLDSVDLPWTWSVGFRVLRDGHERASGGPDVGLMPAEEQPPHLAIDYGGVVPSEEARTAAEYAVWSALAGIGLSPSDVAIAAPVLAPVPAPVGGAIAFVTVRVPSGATVISAQWAAATPDGILGGPGCGMDVRPAGPPPEDGVLVTNCELWDPLDGRSRGEVLVVAAPAPAAAIRAYRGDGAFLAEFELPDSGVLVAPSPDGVGSVEAVTEGGVLLGRTELLGQWTPSG